MRFLRKIIVNQSNQSRLWSIWIVILSVLLMLKKEDNGQ